MSKEDDTQTRILEAGMSAAAAEGVASISIGELAKRVGMSKSGLFAHFGSKEHLQLAVLQHARQTFAEMVVGPALGKPRGIVRVR